MSIPGYEAWTDVNTYAGGLVTDPVIAGLTKMEYHGPVVYFKGTIMRITTVFS